MSDPFLGELRLFPYTFSPQGWAACDGQLLPISQNTALFSLLGTTYGGNGVTTFALPDLRGRVPVHQGQGPGLSDRTLGEQDGAEATTLTTAQLPAHTHLPAVSSAEASTNRPAGAVPARGGEYAPTPDGSGAPSSPTGGSQPVPLLQPYLVLRWCIALNGIYPSRS